MIQYAVINYDARPNDDNEVHVKHITDNFDYANKLAFHYAKKELPSKKSIYYNRTEFKIIKNYPESCNIFLQKTIVDYRICEVKYDDDDDEYELNASYDVWAVVEVNNNDDEKVEDIDETLICEY